MLKTNITRIFKELKISKPDLEQIDRLLNRPEVQAVLGAEENEQIGHRKELIAELSLIPKKIETAKLAAKAQNEAIVKRWHKAEAEYFSALSAYKEMCQRDFYTGASDERRARNIELELLSGSDQRITQYLNELSRVEGAVLSKFESWPVNIGRDWLGKLVAGIDSNGVDVDTARAAVLDACKNLRNMQLLALTYDEVTSRLKALTEILSPALWKLKIHPPTIDERNEVKAPLADGVPAGLEPARVTGRLVY